MDTREVKKIIAEDVAVATEELFKTMVAMELKHDSSLLAEETNVQTDISGFVSFMGKYHGTVGIFCSKKFALKIASGMLMEEMTEVNADVIDTVGEIANMVAGNVKTKITESYGEMELSVPIVMLGNGTEANANENTLISLHTKESWMLTSFCLDDDIFKVGLLLKELAG